MWRSALSSFSSVAPRKAAPPLATSAFGVTADSLSKRKSLKSISVDAQHSSSPFASNAELLQTAQDDLAFVVHQVELQNSLRSHPKAQRSPLVSSTQQTTATQAFHTLAALLGAGKTEDISRIVTTWNDTSAKLPLRQRVRITKKLSRSIAYLVQIKDAVTLRSFLTILVNANVDAQNNGRNNSSSLFSKLGKKRAQLVQMRATAALCRLPDSDGVSLMEKLYWIEQCASPTMVLGQEQLLIPFSLYVIMREVVELDAERNGADNDEIEQLAPELFASAVSPFQADVSALVRLPRSELVKMRDSEECAAALPTVTATSTFPQSAAAARLLRQVTASSRPLQIQARNAALVRAMTKQKNNATRAEDLKSKSSPLPAPEAEARRELITVMKGRQRHTRRSAHARDVCRSIVTNRELMAAMNLSPTIVLSCYLRAFFSVGTVSPVVAKTTAAVIPRLCARHLYETTAYVAWNHLSSPCDAVAKVFGKNPRLLDMCVGSACQIMQRNARGGSAAKWMGHRSIALLRAASVSTPVTPMHCISVCAGAVNVGVHYASVEELLRDLFPEDKATADWTLDMIRLCASNNESTVRKSTKRNGMSRLLQSLLRNARNAMGNRAAARGIVPVATVSRSKQLALWQTVRAPTENPILKSLTLSLFTNEVARRHLVDGTVLLGGQDDSFESRAQTNSEKPLEQLMTWEVLASIATNCTSEALYSEMVESLTNRQLAAGHHLVTGTPHVHRLGNEEKMRKLLMSELDEEKRTRGLQRAM